MPASLCEAGQPAEPTSLREALAGLGPFFALDRPDPAERLWQPLSALLGSPRLLTERVAAVRSALGGEAVPVRVAASVAQLGVAARLVAPAFGAAVLEGRVLSLDRAWWQPAIGGPMPLALGDDDVASVPYECLADAFDARVLNGPVRDLTVLTAALSVSPQVLWGNVASSLNGAATMVAAARPDLAATARRFATELLSLPILHRVSTGMAIGSFRRRSCCLLYRLGPPAPKAVCGDCVLTRG